MSFMIKIAFALPLIVASAVGGSTSSAAPAAEDDGSMLPDRPGCSQCDSAYDNCIEEGLSVTYCQRLTANCYKNCYPST